jgi:predicted RNase H-like HicB family nuclease
MLLRKKRTITFQVDVCVEKDENNFYAYCPSLKGVHVDGITEQEALENIKEAITLYLKSLIKHNEPIPIVPIQSTVSEQEENRGFFVCPPEQRFTESISLAI